MQRTIQKRMRGVLNKRVSMGGPVSIITKGTAKCKGRAATTVKRLLVLQNLFDTV